MNFGRLKEHLRKPEPSLAIALDGSIRAFNAGASGLFPTLEFGRNWHQTLYELREVLPIAVNEDAWLQNMMLLESNSNPYTGSAHSQLVRAVISSAPSSFVSRAWEMAWNPETSVAIKVTMDVRGKNLSGDFSIEGIFYRRRLRGHVMTFSGEGFAGVEGGRRYIPRNIDLDESAEKVPVVTYVQDEGPTFPVRW